MLVMVLVKISNQTNVMEMESLEYQTGYRLIFVPSLCFLLSSIVKLLVRKTRSTIPNSFIHNSLHLMQ